MKIAYPAALIYAALYVVFILLCRFILIGVPAWCFLLSVFFYPIIWLVLYSRCRHNVSCASSMKAITTNIGVGGWNIILLVVSIILLVLPLIYRGFSYQCVPLFIIVAFSALINLRAGVKEEWHIKSPTETRWGKWSPTPDKVRVKVGSQNDDSNKTIVEREYKWEMKNKWNIKTTPDDDVRITFFKEDWEGEEPLMRKNNPFWGKDGTLNWLLAQQNLADSTKIVLGGPNNGYKSEEEMLKTIVDSAIAIANKYNLAAFEVPELLLTFCQYNVTYKVDEESTPINQFRNEDGILEYFRFASETLYDKEGDCDCKAILAYCLMNALGLDAQLVTICKKGQTVPTHVAMIVKDEDNRFKKCAKYPEYAYCEATGEGWKIGNIPKEFDENTMQILA